MEDFEDVFYVVYIVFCFFASCAAILAYQKSGARKSPVRKADATMGGAMGLVGRLENAGTPHNQDPQASWYCAVGNNQTGPFTLVQLRHVLSRFASDELYVWNVEMEDWKRPYEIPELTVLPTWAH
jgi:hypothetical protein